MRRAFYIFLLLFLLSDVIFSFVQHTQFPLDGDMPGIILPSQSYQTVMDDPFGIKVLLHDSVYPATNRFFAHWFMSSYFKSVPVLLQHIANPVDSIYYACALAKTFIQFFTIYLLASFITGKRNLFDVDFLLTAALLTPLFQTFGYNKLMGIIDSSVTYTFFYAFALSLVLLFFLPYFHKFYHNRPVKFDYKRLIVIAILAFVISFNGPLNPAVTLIVCVLVILQKWWVHFVGERHLPVLLQITRAFNKIPRSFSLVFLLVVILSLYSLYIGANNSENLWSSVSLGERYAKLPVGLYYQLNNKLGPPLILIMIIANTIIIKNQGLEQEKLWQLLKWIGIFIILYIVLLPLGGYRDYRPNVIRRDTFMPAMIAMIFTYGITTLYILKNLRKKRYAYYLAVLIFSFVFINADATIQRKNQCERKAFEKLASSEKKIVELNSNCTVFSWLKIEDYEDSFLPSELLHYWGVTKERRFYHQQ